MRRSHALRWITSLIAIPLLAALIYYAPSWLFSVFIGLVAFVTTAEYFMVVYHRRQKPLASPFAILGALVCIAMITSAAMGHLEFIFYILMANSMIAAMLSMPSYGKNKDVIMDVAYEIQMAAYIPLSLSMAVLMRNSGGPAWVFFLVFVIFAGDVGAYYAGTYLGRTPLAPSISPKKTVEGAVGGLAVNLVVGSAFKYLFLPGLYWRVAIPGIILAGIVGQLGDLFESQLKRSSGIKDSGGILPGHGGLWDRIDAVLFAIPVFYILQRYF